MKINKIHIKLFWKKKKIEKDTLIPKVVDLGIVKVVEEKKKTPKLKLK